MLLEGRLVAKEETACRRAVDPTLVRLTVDYGTDDVNGFSGICEQGPLRLILQAALRSFRLVHPSKGGAASLARAAGPESSVPPGTTAGGPGHRTRPNERTPGGRREAQAAIIWNRGPCAPAERSVKGFSRLRRRAKRALDRPFGRRVPVTVPNNGSPWRWRSFPESLCNSNCISDALAADRPAHELSERIWAFRRRVVEPFPGLVGHVTRFMSPSTVGISSDIVG